MNHSFKWTNNPNIMKINFKSVKISTFFILSKLKDNLKIKNLNSTQSHGLCKIKEI